MRKLSLPLLPMSAVVLRVASAAVDFESCRRSYCPLPPPNFLMEMMLRLLGALIFPTTSAAANSSAATKASAAEIELLLPLPTPLPFAHSHCQRGTCHFCFEQGNEANTALQLAEALTWPLLLESLSPSLLLPAVLAVPQVARQCSYLHTSGRKQSTERSAICPKS